MQKLRVRDRFRVVKGGVEYEFEPAEDGGYVVSVPTYPSCLSDGDSFEEALTNAEDALRETLLAAVELGLEIPAGLKGVIS